MIALYTVWSNFIRIHNTLKMSPAMAAGVAATLWSMDDLCGMMDAVAPKPGPYGAYKKRSAPISKTLPKIGALPRVFADLVKSTFAIRTTLPDR